MGGGAAILLWVVLLTITVVVVVSLVKRSGRRTRAALAGLPESAEDVSRSALLANGLALTIVGAVLSAGLTLALAFGDARQALVSLVFLCVLLLLPGIVLLTPLPHRLTLQHQRRLLIGLTVYDSVLAALATVSIVLAIVFIAVAVRTGKAARRMKTHAIMIRPVCRECGRPLHEATDTVCRECGAPVIPSTMMREVSPPVGEMPPMFGQPAGATSTFEPLPPSGSDSQRVQPNYAQGAPRRGVAGFALSLVGFIMPVVWPVGLVLSWRDIRREKRERQPHGLSLAGLVVSAVGTTAVAVLVVAFLAGAPIPVLSNLRDTPGNSAVKEGIHTIQHGVEAWAADHGGVYPRSGRVSQAGLAEYVDAWPDNPYTLLPMTHGTDRGDFYYTLAEGFSSFSLTGYGDDDKAIIEVR